MTLIPWRNKRQDEPQVPATGFRTEMDRLFDSFFGDVPAWGQRGWPTLSNWQMPDWQPPLDVEETDKELLVRAEIPGVNAEELEVAMQNGALVISGEKRENTERKEKGYVYQERRYGSFRREVALPAAVDEQNVKAEYKDGVLHVTLQKAQEALPKKIKVTAQ
ncbi:MAG: Hsp20/alpha crystallin family protein [Pirellulales bacterium]